MYQMYGGFALLDHSLLFLVYVFAFVCCLTAMATLQSHT